MVDLYLPFQNAYEAMAERDFIALPRVSADDVRSRAALARNRQSGNYVFRRWLTIVPETSDQLASAAHGTEWPASGMLSRPKSGQQDAIGRNCPLRTCEWFASTGNSAQCNRHAMSHMARRQALPYAQDDVHRLPQ